MFYPGWAVLVPSGALRCPLVSEVSRPGFPGFSPVEPPGLKQKEPPGIKSSPGSSNPALEPQIQHWSLRSRSGTADPSQDPRIQPWSSKSNPGAPNLALETHMKFWSPPIHFSNVKSTLGPSNAH